MSTKAAITEQEKEQEQEQQQWVKQQYQNAAKFLATKGMICKSVIESDSRYLAPLLSVWKMVLQDESGVWVIVGDLPSDFSQDIVARDAREALRHFSLKWQMQADKLLANGNKEQTAFAQLLINRAEDLYDLFNKDEFWR